MKTNTRKLCRQGFTLIEMTILLIMAIAISLMGLQMIQQQGWIQQKMNQLDSVERTGLVINTLCNSMADSWKADLKNRTGNTTDNMLVFTNKNPNITRVVSIEKLAVVRVNGTFSKLVGKTYANQSDWNAGIELTTQTYDLTDSIITEVTYDKDLSSIEINITDYSGASTTSYAATNPT